MVEIIRGEMMWWRKKEKKPETKFTTTKENLIETKLRKYIKNGCISTEFNLIYDIPNPIDTTPSIGRLYGNWNIVCYDMKYEESLRDFAMDINMSWFGTKYKVE